VSQLETLAGCPLCARPLAGVLRHGRPEKKRRIDLAQADWVAGAGRRLAAGRQQLLRGQALLAGLAGSGAAGAP